MLQHENDSVISFECSKGNIDSRITGVWEEDSPPTHHPRCMAGAVVLGKSTTIHVVSLCVIFMGRKT